MAKQKLYRVARWENNQHKLYTYLCELQNARDVALEAGNYDEVDRLYDACAEAERLLDVFNGYVGADGIARATYPDYCKLKDIIGGYDVRHDFLDAQARADEMFLDDEWGDR